MVVHEPSQAQEHDGLIGEAERLLIASAGLLDQIKAEWGDQWSEWDQSIRDGITAWLIAASLAPRNDGATHQTQDPQT
jgi:hypothetical protein